jgi:lauroyl/myristoyl acyltransferase
VTVGYLSYRLVEMMSRFFPGPLAYWVGMRVADICYLVSKRDRESVMSNLRQIYEGKGVTPSRRALKGMSRKTFQYFGKYLVDFFRYKRITMDEVRERVSVEHLEYLDEVRKSGRGVLLATAHFGNWELGGAVLNAMGCDISVVVMPQRVRKVNDLLQQWRQARGMDLIPVGNAAVGIMKRLKRGRMVGVLTDRDFSGRNDRIDFFGSPARMPMGPAWFSVRCNAPVLPLYLFRLEDDTFMIRFHEPIYPEKVNNDVDEIRRRLVASMEREVGERPSQWFLFEDFWKTSGMTFYGDLDA